MPSPQPTSRDQRRLLALLTGELPAAEARDLERRLVADDALRARYERLAATWQTLEPPPDVPVPAGFRDAVTAAARRQGGELSWSRAPTWARAGAAAALVAGLALGVVLGQGAPPDDLGLLETAAAESEINAYLTAEVGATTLAEAYWLELEEGAGLDLEEAAP